MRSHFLSFVLLALPSTLLPAGCKTPTEEPVVDSSAEEYAIYRLVIDDIVQPVESVPVVNDTISNHLRDGASEEAYRFVQTEFKKLKAATLESFWSQNQARTPLEFKLDLPHGNVFISDEETSKVPSYPGYVELSRVGFDPEMTQALVYLGNCWKLEGFQGRGWYVMLEKKDGAWSILQKVPARLS